MTRVSKEQYFNVVFKYEWVKTVVNLSQWVGLPRVGFIHDLEIILGDSGKTIFSSPSYYN